MSSHAHVSGSGRALLTWCPAATRAAAESIVELERGIAADADHRPLVERTVQLVEHELVRLVLDPLKPWGEVLAGVLADKTSGRPGADTIRMWAVGGKHSVFGIASRVLQALRKGSRTELGW